MLSVVEKGMVTFTELKDGSVDLADVALCYDFLACRADNEELIARWRAEDRDG